MMAIHPPIILVGTLIHIRHICLKKKKTDPRNFFSFFLTQLIILPVFRLRFRKKKPISYVKVLTRSLTRFQQQQQPNWNPLP